MPRDHGHHHHVHHAHHINHHHHNRHHHHNVHHHAPVSSMGSPMGVHTVGNRVGAPGNNAVCLGAWLGVLGFFFLFSGILMMLFGFKYVISTGIAGGVVTILSLCLIIAFVVVCRKARLQQQQQVVLNQQGGTTSYGQPRAQPQIVQPIQPGASPIVQPQAPGATILYGPGGQVAYQTQIQPGIQPPPQQYPAPTISYPQQDPSGVTPKAFTSSDPAQPPPTYDEAVNLPSKPENDKDGPAVVKFGPTPRSSARL